VLRTATDFPRGFRRAMMHLQLPGRSGKCPGVGADRGAVPVRLAQALRITQADPFCMVIVCATGRGAWPRGVRLAMLKREWAAFCWGKGTASQAAESCVGSRARVGQSYGTSRK
jgi:hypothetical protein